MAGRGREADHRWFAMHAVGVMQFQRGGMRASSGIAIEALGDKNDDMIIAVACVTVGY